MSSIANYLIEQPKNIYNITCSSITRAKEKISKLTTNDYLLLINISLQFSFLIAIANTRTNTNIEKLDLDQLSRSQDEHLYNSIQASIKEAAEFGYSKIAMRMCIAPLPPLNKDNIVKVLNIFTSNIDCMSTYFGFCANK